MPRSLCCRAMEWVERLQRCKIIIFTTIIIIIIMILLIMIISNAMQCNACDKYPDWWSEWSACKDVRSSFLPPSPPPPWSSRSWLSWSSSSSQSSPSPSASSFHFPYSLCVVSLGSLQGLCFDTNVTIILLLSSFTQAHLPNLRNLPQKNTQIATFQTQYKIFSIAILWLQMIHTNHNHTCSVFIFIIVLHLHDWILPKYTKSTSTQWNFT